MATLKDIINNKKKQIKAEKEQESIEQLKEKIKSLPRTRNFLRSIRKKGVNIIAETKIKSPTNPKELSTKSMLELAKIYKTSNVAAVSILTDKKYFGGSKEIMKKIKETTDKPILRKDFIIDEYQIYQSRAYGADAILLISSILSKEKLKRFIQISRKLGMGCLVEFNNKQDLKKIPRNAKIYGRNYRIINLNTDFSKRNIHQNIYNAPTYIENIPPDAIKVAESCIQKKEDIAYLKEKGFNAFLIGTAISSTNRIKKKIKELASA